ncbi:GFA family protein [Luteibacter yeojuensis]
MAKKHTGRCACGAITFEFDTDPGFVADCYCLDCQRASGGTMATFMGVPVDDFVLLSGAPKAYHYIANSGLPLERNFCPNCGSRVFTSNLGAFPGMVFVMLGSLDRPDRVKPMLEMFTRRRQPWQHEQTKEMNLPQFTDMPH